VIKTGVFVKGFFVAWLYVHKRAIGNGKG